MQEIVIFGTGGHAKVVYDIVIKQGVYKPVAFVSIDDKIQTFLGLPHIHQQRLAETNYSAGIIAIGDNWIRHKVVEFVLSFKKDFKFVSAIHPSAQIGHESVIGSGSVIMANAVVNPGTQIKDHVIINTQSSVDHDCVIQQFASVAPGVTLGGGVSVGEFSAISLGAKIIHGIKIGNHTVVGAGAVVLDHIEDHTVAYGIPCRKVRTRKAGEKYL